jgi:hypothetical protein
MGRSSPTWPHSEGEHVRIYMRFSNFPKSKSLGVVQQARGADGRLLP